MSAAKNYEKNVFPREWFEKNVYMTFGDREFMVSQYYHELLTSLYGEYLVLPEESERICKVHAEVVDLEHSYEMYADYQRTMKITQYTRSIR